MSDENTQADGGQQNQQPGGDTTPQPTPDGQGAPAQQPGEQRPDPFAIFPDADAFNARMDREARSRMNKTAKDAGFESWDAMTQRYDALRQALGDDAGKVTPDQPTNEGPDEAARLRMAVSVAQEVNLPVALIGRLQGGTADEMKADAESLMALVGASSAGVAVATPGVPAAPQGDGLPTVTAEQRRDPKWIRENESTVRALVAAGQW